MSPAIGARTLRAPALIEVAVRADAVCPAFVRRRLARPVGVEGAAAEVRRRDAEERPAGLDGAPLRCFNESGMSPIVNRSGLEARERRSARVDGRVAELILDTDELVVLVDALTASGSTGLDLARTKRNSEVGDRGVLGLA